MRERVLNVVHRGGDHFLDPQGGGMDMIGLHQIGLADHWLKKERDEFGAVFPRERGIDRIEVRGVILPKVRRRQHAQHDHANAAIAERLQNLGQVLARLCRRQPPQHVVAAEADDREFRLYRLAVQREGKALQCGCRGVTRDAGIGDLRVDATSAKGGLQPGGVALAIVQAIAGQ